MEEKSFSIVVPTFNRLDCLQKSLKALFNLDYSNFEIIIVNDFSNDDTKDYLDSLENEKVKVIHNDKNEGPALARNKGIKESKNKIIAFSDDDCIVDKDWLKNLNEKFDENTDFVFGKTIYIDKEYKGYFPEKIVDNSGGNWPGTGNIAYKRHVFDEIGGFSDKYYKYQNEDSEMAIRAVKNGFKYKKAKDALVYHQKADWNIKSLLKSSKNASVWVLLKKEYKDSYSEFGSPVFFNIFIYPKDYLYIILSPILIPILLIRYIYHGKKDLKIFFTKWPIYFFLRRYYIYKESKRNKVLMI